jgi:hypothetical protein
MLGFDDYGEEMGRNDVSVFLCNASVWGDVGRNRVSALEMGIEGRGRVSDLPIGAERWRTGTRSATGQEDRAKRKTNFR